MPQAEMTAPATILIVDDKANLRGMLADVLDAEGCRCIVAANGPDALRIVQAGIVKIDLLLCEVIIQGGMDGIQLARHVRQLQPDTRVVLMTGYFDKNQLRTLERSGFPILRKPLALQEVRATVHRELQRNASAVVIRFRQPRRPQE
jgi:DNA-binding NtrC family response regulator